MVVVKGVDLPKRVIDLDLELKKLQKLILTSPSEADQLVAKIIAEYGVDGAVAHKQKRAERTQRRKEKKT